MKRLLVGLCLFLSCLGTARADGQITVHWEPSKREVGERIRGITQLQQAWGEIAKVLNATFVLPRNLPIIFADIGQANAFYSPDKHVIIVGYEMFEELGNTYRSMSSTNEELGNHMLGGIFFIFFHEFGHALIGECAIPATGREEDAVDEFSALLLAESEFGQNAMVSAAAYFAATAGNPSPQAYFDEHSLNQQRVSTIMTILYASNPQAFGALCQQMGIPERTLTRAQHDLPKKQKAWETLLKPHMEPGATL
jgi:hypothetical protein